MLDLSAFQAAVIAGLRGDSRVLALVGSASQVRDRVPERRTLPLIVVGTLAQTPWEGDDAPGVAVEMRLDAWSRAANRGEIHRLVAAIHDRLDELPPIMGTIRLVLIEPISVDTQLSRTNRAFHAILRFRALLEPVEA